MKHRLKYDWQKIAGPKLSLELVLPDFQQAVEMVGKIAVVAEKQNHHPDLKIHDYDHLTIEIYTHEAGSLTDKDYQLAKEIEKVISQ